MLPSIAKLAAKHNISPLKKYGQNFIFDQSLCDKIVKFAGDISNNHVIEIGPGPAGLTRSILMANPQKLTVIETDQRCLALLNEIKQYYPNLDILHADALKIPITDLAHDSKISLISNLPYNIGTPLLISYLKEISSIHSMTFMLQKEVVDRIIAKPNSKQYGRLSVICQLICDTAKCFDVSPKAFYPEPKIWSSIIKLIPHQNPPNIELIQTVEKITLAAFSGRRKMIKSSLKTAYPHINIALETLGIDQSLRAENLSPSDYANLATLLIN